jgi:hypothetical protein
MEYNEPTKDYMKTQPGDTEEQRKMRSMAQERMAMRGTSNLVGDRMKRPKRSGRKMER